MVVIIHTRFPYKTCLVKWLKNDFENLHHVIWYHTITVSQYDVMEHVQFCLDDRNRLYWSTGVNTNLVLVEGRNALDLVCESKLTTFLCRRSKLIWFMFKGRPMSRFFTKVRFVSTRLFLFGHLKMFLTRNAVERVVRFSIEAVWKFQHFHTSNKEASNTFWRYFQSELL